MSKDGQNDRVEEQIENQEPVVEEKIEATTQETPEQTQERIKDEKPVGTTNGYTHRYVDPACTGIAYYSQGLHGTEHPVANCKNCGAPLGQVNIANFIVLTEDEKQALIDQGL